MISGTYLGSAALVAVLGVLLLSDSPRRPGRSWRCVLATFFFASAGASSAYLTVSEVFPMETRALAIALFYAVGTAAGGIAGPLLFGQFIHSGDTDQVAIGFFIGAGAMALGGVAELFLGVRAEQQSLENIAQAAHRRGGRGAEPAAAAAAAGAAEAEPTSGSAARRPTSAGRRAPARPARAGRLLLLAGDARHRRHAPPGYAAASDQELDARSRRSCARSPSTARSSSASSSAGRRPRGGARALPRALRVALEEDRLVASGWRLWLTRRRRRGKPPRVAGQVGLRRDRSQTSAEKPPPRGHPAPGRPPAGPGDRGGRRARRQLLLLVPLLSASSSPTLPVRAVRHRRAGSPRRGQARSCSSAGRSHRSRPRAAAPAAERLDPGSAGVAGFLVRLVTLVTVVLVSLRIAGLHFGALALGASFTAVIIGLAAQQTWATSLPASSCSRPVPSRWATESGSTASGWTSRAPSPPTDSST